MIPTSFYKVFQEEPTFLGLIGLFFFIAGVTFPHAEVAKWVGFALAGRKIAMTFTDVRGKGKLLKTSPRLITKDAGYALIGLAVSIALAAAINVEIKDELLGYFWG